MIYETFHDAPARAGQAADVADHLLEPGELRRHFAGFDVLCYEEVLAPDAVARLVARSLQPIEGFGGQRTLPG